jgi:SAM-dependent methyltransferase
MDPARYFAQFDEWSPTSRYAVEQARGRVLDIGAGAGRAALTLQANGFDVVALDVSPGAAEVCHKRGVRSVFEGTVFDLAMADTEGFDAFLMLGNNLGLLGGREQAVALLDALASISRRGARILGETVDPYATDNPDHVRYHEENHRAGRMGGQLRLRHRHLRLASPWLDYLFCTSAELESVIAPTRWRLVEQSRARSGSERPESRWPTTQWLATLELRP